MNELKQSFLNFFRRKILLLFSLPERNLMGRNFFWGGGRGFAGVGMG